MDIANLHQDILSLGAGTLLPEQMGADRYDMGKTLFRTSADDDYFKTMAPDWSRVKVPLLSAANWGGQPLHPRGNFEGYFRAATKQKWLEVHGIERWTPTTPTTESNLQRRFSMISLKKNGWDK